MRILRSLAAIALVVSLAVLAAGCSSASKGGAIEARSWQLRAYADSSGAMKDAYLTVPLDARFETGTVAGAAGCSTFKASYTIAEASLTVTGLQVGTETCDSYATQGRDTYMAALPLADTFKVDGSQLTIYSKDGHELLRFQEKP